MAFNDFMAKMSREHVFRRKEHGVPFREPTASRRERCRDIGNAPIELNPRRNQKSGFTSTTSSVSLRMAWG